MDDGRSARAVETTPVALLNAGEELSSVLVECARWETNRATLV